MGSRQCGAATGFRRGAVVAQLAADWQMSFTSHSAIRLSVDMDEEMLLSSSIADRLIPQVPFPNKVSPRWLESIQILFFFRLTTVGAEPTSIQIPSASDHFSLASAQ